MMPWAHEAVDHAERVLIESVMDSGWTWEQLGSVYGERSKQAMQQHYKRRGGQRSWPAARRPEADPPDVESVRHAITGLILNFRATDEALTRTMAGASWNDRDPGKEALRRLSWTERLNDSLAELNDFINNRIAGVPRVDRPLVVGERIRLHPDRMEIGPDDVEQARAEIDKVIARLEQHRDTVDATVDELRRRRTELG